MSRIVSVSQLLDAYNLKLGQLPASFKWVGLLIYLLAVLAGVGTVMAGVVLIEAIIRPLQPDSHQVFFMHLGCAVVGMAVFSYIKTVAQRVYSAAHFTSVISSEKPISFFLRPFSTDNEMLSEPPRGGIWGLISASQNPNILWSVESLVGKTLSDSYIFVSIGRPGEKLPAAGSNRIYARDEVWQNVASDLIAMSRIVFLRVGSTPNVRWELSQILHDGVREKCIILTIDPKGKPASPALLKDVAPELHEWIADQVSISDSVLAVRFPDHGRAEIKSVDAACDVQKELTSVLTAWAGETDSHALSQAPHRGGLGWFVLERWIHSTVSSIMIVCAFVLLAFFAYLGGAFTSIGYAPPETKSPNEKLQEIVCRHKTKEGWILDPEFHREIREFKRLYPWHSVNYLLMSSMCEDGGSKMK